MNEKYKSKLPALVGAAMLNEWGSDVKQSILTPKQHSSSTRKAALVMLILPSSQQA